MDCSPRTAPTVMEKQATLTPRSLAHATGVEDVSAPGVAAIRHAGPIGAHHGQIDAWKGLFGGPRGDDLRAVVLVGLRVIGEHALGPLRGCDVVSTEQRGNGLSPSQRMSRGPIISTADTRAKRLPLRR